MDKIVFGSKVLNLAQNGIQMMNDKLVVRVATSNFDEVEAVASGNDLITQTLTDGTKVSVYSGFTKLFSIEKLFNQRVDFKDVSTQKEVQQLNPETNEEETVTVTETERVPVMSDVCVVTLERPTLEATVADYGAQIDEMQGMIKEMVM